MRGRGMELHSISPIYNKNSKILILGSFPSVSSREEGFFYAHPQNRFWRLIAALFGASVPQGINEKRELLLAHGIALWDVIASCDLTGSADGTIRNVTPNDMTEILRTASLRAVFLNGKTAARYYDRYLRQSVGLDAIVLPSTSPANAAYSFEALRAAWSVLLSFTDQAKPPSSINEDM